MSIHLFFSLFFYMTHPHKTQCECNDVCVKSNQIEFTVQTNNNKIYIFEKWKTSLEFFFFCIQAHIATIIRLYIQLHFSLLLKERKEEKVLCVRIQKANFEDKHQASVLGLNKFLKVLFLFVISKHW